MEFPYRVLSFLQRHLSFICYPIQSVVATAEFGLMNFCWALLGFRKPTAEDADLVAKNVTFLFKSFERQKQARALVKSIRKYYPGTRMVIADDSSSPLQIPSIAGDLTVIQMPFNSGLSKGLNLALAEVNTPFLMRMDDDELLTRHVNLASELRFLHSHPEVDLVGIPCIDACKPISVKKGIQAYSKFDMRAAPLPLKIPNGTVVDEEHIVFGKVPNIFLARTESVKKVGWDDNIRMIDHHDFFYRAAGILVSVLSMNSVVFHNHNFFSPHYNRYRSDWKGDAAYLRRVRYKRISSST